MEALVVIWAFASQNAGYNFANILTLTFAPN